MWRKATYCRSASVAALATVPVILGCALLGATGARAAPYVVTIEQEGNNVVAMSNAGGEFNLSGLNLFSTDFPIVPGMGASVPRFGIGGTAFTNTAADAYSGVSGPTSFGSSDFIFSADSSSGPIVGIAPGAPFGLPGFGLGVPQGYASGDPLPLSESTYDDTTLASLGLTPGTDFTWTWGGAAFPDQSFSIDVVPLPAALPLFASGLGGLGLLGWRRKRRAQAVA